MNRSAIQMMKYENQFNRIANLSHSRVKGHGQYGFIGESQYNKIHTTERSGKCLSGNWFEEQVLRDAMSDMTEEEKKNTFHSVMKKNQMFKDMDEAKKVNVSHLRPKSKAKVAMDRDGKYVSVFMEDSNDVKKKGKVLPRNAQSTPYIIGDPKVKHSIASTHMEEFKEFIPEKSSRGKRKQYVERMLMKRVVEEEMEKLRKKEEEKRKIKEERAKEFREKKVETVTDKSSLYNERPISFESQRVEKWKKKGIITHNLPSGYYGRSSYFSQPKGGI